MALWKARTIAPKPSCAKAMAIATEATCGCVSCWRSPNGDFCLFHPEGYRARLMRQGFSKVAVKVNTPRRGPREGERRSAGVGERRWGRDANPSARALR